MTGNWKRQLADARGVRLERERRYFRPGVNLSGHRCIGCSLLLPTVLTDAGVYRHPTCWPGDPR